MFVFHRSAAAVLLPLALLALVVLWSGRSSAPAPQAHTKPEVETVTVAQHTARPQPAPER